MPTAPVQTPLPAGCALEGYRIERPLAQGGFAVVYLARDGAGESVIIKEYLPAGLTRRTPGETAVHVEEAQQGAFNTGMKHFFAEGRLLADIDHPNLVRVLNFLRANGTAYLVMRDEGRRTLKDHARALRRDPAGIPEAFLRTVFVRLLAGLREVHARQLLHLDIKPANILVRDDGEPVLLDFGAARRGLDPRAGHNPVYTPGFAAPELQGLGGALGPWTDIYAVGASLYDCLAGAEPPAADQRLQGDTLVPAVDRWAGAYSPQLLELIDWCLQLAIERRPQSVHALQKVLGGDLLDLVDPNWFDGA